MPKWTANSFARAGGRNAIQSAEAANSRVVNPTSHRFSPSTPSE